MTISDWIALLIWIWMAWSSLSKRNPAPIRRRKTDDDDSFIWPVVVVVAVKLQPYNVKVCLNALVHSVVATAIFSRFPNVPGRKWDVQVTHHTHGGGGPVELVVLWGRLCGFFWGGFWCEHATKRKAEPTYTKFESHLFWSASCKCSSIIRVVVLATKYHQVSEQRLMVFRHVP